MTKGKAGKKKSRSIKSKKSGLKPIKKKMSKRELNNHLVASLDANMVGDLTTRQTTRLVASVMDELAEVMARSIMPGGVGEFMLPRLLKVTLRERRAIKKGTMVRSPATGEMVPSKGRPASKTVKIRPLANLKKAAAGEL